MILLTLLFSPFKIMLLSLITAICSYMMTPYHDPDHSLDDQHGYVAGCIVSGFTLILFVIFCIISIFYYIKF